MNIGLRRENRIEIGLDVPVEFLRAETGAKDRNRALGRHLQQSIGRRQGLRDKRDRNSERKHALDPFPSLLWGQTLQIPDFGLTKHLDSIRREPLRVPGQRDPRARQIRVRDRPIQVDVGVQDLELERLMPLIEQPLDADLGDQLRRRPRRIVRQILLLL